MPATMPCWFVKRRSTLALAMRAYHTRTRPSATRRYTTQTHSRGGLITTEAVSNDSNGGARYRIAGLRARSGIRCQPGSRLGPRARRRDLIFFQSVPMQRFRSPLRASSFRAQSLLMVRTLLRLTFFCSRSPLRRQWTLLPKLEAPSYFSRNYCCNGRDGKRRGLFRLLWYFSARACRTPLRARQRTRTATPCPQQWR